MVSQIVIDTSQNGRVRAILLDNPSQRNALTLGMRAELAKAIEAAMADQTVRVIVLAGAQGDFCSGGDLSSMDGLTGFTGRERMRRAQSIVRAIVRGEKPVIAAVEGYAAGGGMCLAAACDLVVASRSAKFVCSFNRIGLTPDLGSAWTLPMRMGLGRARLMILTGRTLDAIEAERAGLVEQLVDPGQALVVASALADEIAAKAPLSNAATKALLARMPCDLEGMMQAEADLQGLLYTSADFAEGRDAFREKRRPFFTGG